jgi:hypothetical protein
MSADLDYFEAGFEEGFIGKSCGFSSKNIKDEISVCTRFEKLHGGMALLTWRNRHVAENSY